MQTLTPNCLVTGGTSGIGLAAAKIFLSKGFGCAVVIRGGLNFRRVLTFTTRSFETRN